MAKKKRKTRKTPAVVLANALLDELDIAIQSREPYEEQAAIKTLETAYSLVERALKCIVRVRY